MFKPLRLVFVSAIGVSVVVACGSSDESPVQSSTDGGADSSINNGGDGGGGGGGGGTLCDTAAANACTGTRKCDPALGCVECVADTDCTAAGRDPFCILGRCEACRTNTDCGVAAPACWPSDHRCHASCLVDAGAGGARCGQQSANNLPICDPATGACIGCTAATDCPATAPICEPNTKTCVACAANTDCPAARPRCSIPSFRCVACLVNADCAAGQICNGENQCVAGCTDNTQCTNAEAPKCNTTTGRCVQCQGAGDCTGVANRPLCVTNGDRAGRCVQCTNNADCTDGGAAGTPFCGNNNTCVQCLRRQDCPGNNAQCDNGVCN